MNIHVVEFIFKFKPESLPKKTCYFLIDALRTRHPVFEVEESASDDTLKHITEWFETGHNVAVRIIEMIW